MKFRYTIVVFICALSFLSSAQIKRIDNTYGGMIFIHQGNVLDSFELDSNQVAIDSIVIALNVQGNYLECVLENHTDSTFRLYHSCGQLKVYLESKESGFKDLSGGCDYDNNNYRSLNANTGFNIYAHKSPLWKNIEIRAVITINGRKICSNWVRYE
ncbi:MAG: hypothetical protein ACJA1C_001987 [Crocinitomicaceae bacterium]|jgi:hypothetical protein